MLCRVIGILWVGLESDLGGAKSTIVDLSLT